MGFPEGGGSTVLATTGPSGFALQNATPVILSWTAPAGGQSHYLTVAIALNVTTAQTGGAVSLSASNPPVVGWSAIYAGGLGVGMQNATFDGWGSPVILVRPGQTISLVQSSAQTAGAATLYAALLSL